MRAQNAAEIKWAPVSRVQLAASTRLSARALCSPQWIAGLDHRAPTHTQFHSASATARYDAHLGRKRSGTPQCALRGANSASPCLALNCVSAQRSSMSTLLRWTNHGRPMSPRHLELAGTALPWESMGCIYPMVARIPPSFHMYFSSHPTTACLHCCPRTVGILISHSTTNPFP